MKARFSTMGRWLLVAAGAIATAGWSTFGLPMETDELLASAERAYDRWSDPFDLVAYEPSLREAIDLWVRALEALDPADDAQRAGILVNLSRARFELAGAYLDDPVEIEATYEAGKDAALAALEHDPTFVDTRKTEGFRTALRTATNVGAVFWYGNNLGQWLDFHHFTAFFGGVRDVHAAFERAIELDETYDGGGPHRSMAPLISQAHFLIGRRREEAVDHFERAIELDPLNLENYVNYAAHYARPVGDDALFDRLLRTALEVANDPKAFDALPLYNRLALERARTLVATLEEGKD